ncbi:MAG: HEAT repeat domain-containing protein, partial [Methanolobus sp.]|nr:HEAT repeat domain-containing protein [Methanolobus sp.]
MYKINFFDIKLASALLIVIVITGSGCIYQDQAEQIIDANSSQNDRILNNDISTVQDKLQSLTNIGKEEKVDQWINILRDDLETENNKTNAAEMLGESGDERAIEPLTRIMNDPDENDTLRSIAAANLAKYKDSDIANYLIEALNDEDPGKKWRA